MESFQRITIGEDQDEQTVTVSEDVVGAEVEATEQRMDEEVSAEGVVVGKENDSNSAEERMEVDRATLDPEVFWRRYGTSEVDAEQAQALLRFPDFVIGIAKGIGGDPYRIPVNMSTAERATLARAILRDTSNRAYLRDELTAKLLDSFIAAAGLPKEEAEKMAYRIVNAPRRF